MLDWKSIVRERLLPLRLEPAAESALVEELAQHLEDHYRESLAGGVSEEEAFRIALSELDETSLLSGSRRMPRLDSVPPGDAKTGNLAEDLWRDLRFALRTMRKSPVFVLFVVLTLGLGIGANTTVFTVINTLLLNPLPVQRPSELASIATADVDLASKSAPKPISFADLKDYEAKNEVFSSLAGYTSPRVVTFQSAAASERMFCELITGNYFSTLGLRPALGRFFRSKKTALPERILSPF